jgi:hypothetical protein
MEVEITEEKKDFEVYETEKFRFRINTDALTRLKEKDDFQARLKTKVMKQMKITAKTVTGREWEESVNAIYDEVVK